MKDIDFDELDRAVNSLISPTGAPAAAPQAATPTPASVAPTIPSSGLTAADQLHAPVAPPLAERRSSGRFMDVVHPSSDMRTSPVPPRPSARTGMTITPPSSVTSDPQPEDEVVTPKETEVEATSNSVDSPVSPVEETPSPLESPFLSDAKVEKRPLGAFSTETPQPVPMSTNSLSETPKPEASEEIADEKSGRSDHPIETDTPLPAELQDNLLSIEANEDTAAKKVETAAAPIVSAPVGSTSITTQYTEQPSTGDQPTGTVFDTEAYKKPMVHPKKKSGWLIVLWIFLLLVVGAGVGAAIYFFVLPKV